MVLASCCTSVPLCLYFFWDLEVISWAFALHSFHGRRNLRSWVCIFPIIYSPTCRSYVLSSIMCLQGLQRTTTTLIRNVMSEVRLYVCVWGGGSSWRLNSFFFVFVFPIFIIFIKCLNNTVILCSSCSECVTHNALCQLVHWEVTGSGMMWLYTVQLDVLFI